MRRNSTEFRTNSEIFQSKPDELKFGGRSFLSFSAPSNDALLNRMELRAYGLGRVTDPPSPDEKSNQNLPGRRC